MKVLVTGDRNWTDRQKIYDALSVFDGSRVTLIEGEARGADTLAREVAEELGWQVIKCPAEWSKYGKSAGPIRNQQMLDMEPDIVVAFHSDLANSKGTKDMVNRSRKAGVKVVMIT